MKKLLLTLSTAILIATASFAQRIAIVDVNSLLEGMTEYTSAQSDIDQISAQWRQDIAKDYDQIKSMYNKYQAEQVLLSDDARKQREDEIMDSEKAVREKQKQRFGAEGDLFRKRQELVRPIQDIGIMKSTNLFLILCLFVATATSLTAQKFAYINSQELLSQLPEVKEANSNIEAFQSQLQRKGQEMIQALQTKYAAVEQNRDSYSPIELEQEAQKLKDEETQIIQFEQSSQQKILEKSETLLAPIRSRIEAAIKEVADENGYDYVFDYSMGLVLYASEETNIGALVKAKLGM